MKKKMISILVCMLLFATVSHVAVFGNELDLVTASSDSSEIDYMVHSSSIAEATFSQLDWYYLGDPHTLNSLWGRMDIIAEPDSYFWYMNVVADAGFGPAWIIQNYPIFPEEYGVPNEQVIYFNIEDLGLNEGMPLQGINAIITYDLDPQQTQPQGEFYPNYVTTSIRDAWGHTIEIPETVGTPEGHIADGEVENATKHTNVPSVQEYHNNCITGSYARSIKWLDNEYGLENLPAGTTAQDIYDDLNESGVGHGSGQGKTEEEMLEIKAAYLSGLDGRAVTKFVDLTGWMSNNVTGCTEETPDNLKDWLEEELETEDVEMCYDSHCITITGIYTQGNKTFLEYRDDEEQGDDDVGDTAEKEGELTQVGDGWNFDGAQVDYVVSESINEAPDAPDIDGLTSGKAGTEYDYNFTAIDPDGDDVKYFIDWGDGNTEWTDFASSGTPVIVSHTWVEKDTYIITAKAKDVFDAEGPEGTLDVSMPMSLAFNFNFNLLNWLFERFPNAFPVLRNLLRL